MLLQPQEILTTFGTIQNQKIILSKEGIILNNIFKQISDWNNQIIVDEYIIMPNHFHCILIITDNDFEYPVKSNPDDNEFWLGEYVDTIHELYLRGYHQSKSFNQKWNFTIEPTKKRINNYRKARRNMLLNKIIGKLKMQVAKQISYRIAL